jgi:pantetheine-phosphate adenylyltransferase
MKTYQKVAVGGTFDELHRGHKVLLFKAFEVGERVVIGLTSDELVSKMSKPHVTANYEERRLGLQAFLTDLGLWSRTEVTPLFDPYGSLIKDLGIQALVVSEETKPITLKINERRLSAGLPELKIITITMVPSQNCGPISTTRIRKGEMDREGRLLKTQKPTN